MKAHRYYAFGSYVLDSLRGVLWHEGRSVPLTPKVFELLVTLVTSAGELLGKDELIRRVWAGTVVEENNLARHISSIRKALGERPGQREFIATVPGVGYRFVAEVTELSELPPECRSLTLPAVHAAEMERPGQPWSTPPASLPLQARVAPATARVGRSIFLSALVFVAVGLGAAAAWITIGAPWLDADDSPTARSLRQLTYESGLQQDVAWSPDGRRIAYASDRLGNADIWVQSLGESAPPLRLTTSGANDWQPAWSPDGRWVAFRSERDGGGLYVIAVDGSGERQLTSFGTHPRWSPAGRQILFSRADPETAGAAQLCVVGFEGGPVRAVVLPADLQGFDITNAAWDPDGRISAWGRDDRNEWAFVTFPIEGGVAVRSVIDQSVQRQIASAGLSFFSFAWAPSRRFLYFEGSADSVRNLWRVSVNPRTLAWSGRLERLTTSPGRSAGLAISPDGRRLAFGVSTPRVRLWAFGFDAAHGRIIDAGEDVTPGDADNQDVDASSDGRRLVYRALRNDQSELWERSGNASLRLLASTREWRYSLPRWSPDGTRVAYQRTRNGGTGSAVERFVSILAVDNGQERSLSVPSDTVMVPADWRTDGSALLGGCRWPGAAPMGTCLLSVGDGRLSQIASDDTADLVQHRFSPDQRWVSFGAIPVGDRSTMTVYVMPAGGGARTAITDGLSYDDKPRWGPDGRALFFVSNRGGRSDVWGRRFNTTTGLPEGQVFRVTTFDRGPRIVAPFLGQLGMAISKDHIYLPMYEASGHIWVLDRADQ